jgi:hypothetical protein
MHAYDPSYWEDGELILALGKSARPYLKNN